MPLSGVPRRPAGDETVQAGIELRAAAQARLRDHAYAQLFFATYPAFLPATSFALLQPHLRTHAVHLVRRSDLDGPKLDPVQRLKYLATGIPPTIEETIRAFPPKEAQALVQTAAALKVPLVASVDRFGVDGTRHEFALGDAWAQVHIAWWEDGPAAWAPVWAFFQQTWARFEQVFRDV